MHRKNLITYSPENLKEMCQEKLFEILDISKSNQYRDLRAQVLTLESENEELRNRLVILEKEKLNKEFDDVIDANYEIANDFSVQVLDLKSQIHTLDLFVKKKISTLNESFQVMQNIQKKQLSDKDKSKELSDSVQKNSRFIKNLNNQIALFREILLEKEEKSKKVEIIKENNNEKIDTNNNIIKKFKVNEGASTSGINKPPNNKNKIQIKNDNINEGSIKNNQYQTPENKTKSNNIFSSLNKLENIRNKRKANSLSYEELDILKKIKLEDLEDDLN